MPDSKLRHPLRWLLAPLAVSAAGCGNYGSPVAYCTSVAPIAIEVDVTDSITGLARADSATGFIQTGVRVDSLIRESNSATLLFGGTTLGTYDVTIARPGYATWTRAAVAVTQVGQCGNVLPVRLTALLQTGP
ncbi:MAG: hypothetical protein ABI742_13465 [Gemmatimonadota bacterium]